MADATNIKNLIVNTGAGSYQIAVSNIYAELGVTEERFAELLARDFYCPVLPTEPTAATLTYTDTDGSTNHFAVGQECRVPDVESDDYKVFKFMGTYQGNAVWMRMEEYHPMSVKYVEDWSHDMKYKSGTQVRFNQEFFIALRDTSVPPIPLVYMEDGVIALVSEKEYATIGSYEAAGNKEDWKKIPYDELRLVSREGTLNGAEVNIDDLSGEEVYQFVPNLYVDVKKGTINGVKASELIARIKRIEEKLEL